MSTLEQEQISLVQQFALFVRNTPRAAPTELKARLRAFLERNPPREDLCPDPKWTDDSHLKKQVQAHVKGLLEREVLLESEDSPTPPVPSTPERSRASTPAVTPALTVPDTPAAPSRSRAPAPNHPTVPRRVSFVDTQQASVTTEAPQRASSAPITHGASTGQGTVSSLPATGIATPAATPAQNPAPNPGARQDAFDRTPSPFLKKAVTPTAQHRHWTRNKPMQPTAPSPSESDSRPTTSSSAQTQHGQRPDSNASSTPATEDIGRGSTMDFSQDQLNQIGQIVREALNQARPQVPEVERIDTRTPAWRDSEVGFFHPDCDDAQSGQVITVGHDTVHRDVHTFIDRLRDAVSLRSEPIVRDRIPALLRGKAQQWYTTGLSDLEKAGLRVSPIESWYSRLRDLFKQPLQEALQNLIRCRYTLVDARDRRPAHSYVYDVVRNARDAGMTTPLQQLTHAYAQTDVLLRSTLAEPSANTGLSDYVLQMDRQRENWSQLATIWLRINSPRPQTGNYPNRRAGTQQYQDNRPRANQHDQRSYPPRTYDRPQPDRARTAPTLPAPRERLQLTDGRPSSSTASDARQSSGRGQEPLKPFKARTGYVDSPEEDEPEHEHDAFYGNEEHGYEGGHDYEAHEPEPEENDGFVEVDTHYLQEPSGAQAQECLYCHNQFASGNRLHEHVRATGHGKSKK